MNRLFSFHSIFTLLLVSALFVSWRSGTEEELAFTVVKICTVPSQFASAPLQAQDHCGANSTNVTINPNGGATMIPMHVHAANLIPNGNGTFRLPDGVPAMYVEFDNTNGQNQTVGPVTNFSLEEIVNGWPVYVSIVDLPFYFADPCTGLSLATAQSNVRLVTGLGQFYPLHNYTAEDNIFSCRVFSETCENCNPECAGNPQNPEADYYFCIDCARGGRNQEQGVTQVSGTAWMAEARANPFQDRLVLDLSIVETTEVSIALFTQTGALVYQSVALLKAGQQALSIDTATWQNGAYCCKVSSPHFSKTFTLIKM